MNTPAMAPRRSLVACLYLYIGCTALRLLPQCSATTPTLWFVEAPPAAAGSNDLLDLVRQAMPSAVRTGSIDNIVAGASEGDAVLVLGPLAMGIAGAAWATVGCQLVAAGMLLRTLARKVSTSDVSEVSK